MLKWVVTDKPKEFRARSLGSDPRAATCRGKLQSKRSKLNMEINKELMLRSGAENLFKATTNKKMKEKLSVELYQNSDGRQEIPMIPLGLKETKEIDFQDFFPPDRSLGIFFEWYDSLTGVPSSQRTVAFEKASVLFNIGALYTQIGTRQNRGKTSGLDAAVDNFLRSAARECLFEKSELSFYDKEKDDIDVCLVLGQEASHVSEVFKKVSKIMSQPPVKDYVPYTWVSLSQVKKEYYSALAHYYVAIGLLDHKDDKLSKKTWETLQFLHEEEDKDNKNKSPIIEVRVPTNNQEKKITR
ncbi:Rhophilin-2-B,Rhophilin-2-A [Lepeophtheirus salmonis]|uniref:Rhophilin-2-B,Rhophilin-2-A n=1 Tax=Lepeophtheirus salmonis TaxID=72036 RepID=A0A7R8CW85_LEPSM|nr:Rhophilin-2-B,Rhophilin-2-A [Lepeophtheirus salmonis]CAF2950027.1 Rhophilin-2-B,Rhophilin-2-A [Lepeophtheirus salmonis]